MTTVIANFPAYTVIAAPTGYVFKAGDEIAVAVSLYNKYGTLYHFFNLGSVISYALKCKQDPIAWLDRARANGHELHWANPLSTILTAEPQAKRTYFGLEFGAKIRFEGKTFELVKASNNNVTLVEVK